MCKNQRKYILVSEQTITKNDFSSSSSSGSSSAHTCPVIQENYTLIAMKNVGNF